MWIWLLGCGDPLNLKGEVEPDDTVPEVVSSEPCGACGGDCLLEELLYAERYHAEGGVEYGDEPPAGGPHDPCWTTFGVHDEPVPDENFVHNLEHGAVVILHDPACSGDACDLGPMEALVPSSPWYLTSPYPGLGAPFVALAWGRRLTLGCWDEAEVVGFHDAFANQGPESVMSGPPSSCE